MAVAEAGNIVFVAAEVLLFRSSTEVRFILRCEGGDSLDLERAELLVNYLPDYLIGRHDSGSDIRS